MFLKYFCFLPFFTYEVNRVEDIIKDRTIKKGHIENGKEIIVKIFNFRIIKFNLSKGEILTAEHFYFHRSLEDVKYLLKIKVLIIILWKKTYILLLKIS